MPIDTLLIENIAHPEKLIFGHRVAYVIEKSGISKAWIAEQLGISKQALNYLLKHATKPKFIDELAEILHLNPLWIEKGEGRAGIGEKGAMSKSVNRIPLITKSGDTSSMTGFSLENVESIVAYFLEDNSNFPPFIQGSVLIFDTKKQPQNEDYVLLTINNSVMVRQYLVDGNNTCYKASNSEYKTFINTEALLMGVLIEARYQPH